MIGASHVMRSIDRSSASTWPICADLDLDPRQLPPIRGAEHTRKRPLPPERRSIRER